nr:xylulose kinase-1 [Tanacetum cinerariifolium]
DSEWSRPTGLKLPRENLQCRVKEEDSITNVKNAVFDLGVMDISFLFMDQRVLIVATGRYVVSTGRVIVSTGRYVVLTGRVIVATGRYVVPTGRVIVSTGRYVVLTGRVIVATGRESKARTTLLQSIPDDHVADFHYMDDARDIWNAIKARFGGNAESKKMRKSMPKQDFLEIIIGEAEGLYKRPIFHRFAKTNSMKAVPPPLSGDYTSLSDHIDLDESQMSYGIKSSTSCDSKPVSNDFFSCDDSDKSSEDLPSFSCNKSNKNENTSRTSCNKNGYFNKKASHFRKNASSVSKLCFVCDSGTHLIKDCDFYEKQMANKTVGIRVGHVHCKNKVNHQNQFIPQAVLLRTGKVNIPHARPQLVPTGKPKVFAPVPAGRQNKPFLVPNDRGYSPSVSSGSWKRIDGQLLLSPQQVVLGNHIEKVYTGYPRAIVDLIHLHTGDNVVDLLTKAFDGPRFNHLVVIIEMLNP